ncbi:Zn(2)-C6 fungal-type domain-containing protein [Fusarium keratoplasticum]|uniref:Zn(2)-C6 fungal-type domain-containing protein n=1 Tax=Fusarium keratoplasticum TaxID=1328300 RepID=A0ACC0R7P1_9HYPO|nr:Zn(2)-C6 fungal-type domain-containing protein [Fusarium keratoplasticum]KAI8679270.1 Zn(2)-C6 fungal-type domain-containing protein [Fusarium keratoplasticum]
MATDRPDTFGVMNESTTTSRSPDSSRPTPTKRNLACERCWKRKQKCDRLLPACTACADLGVECVARSQQVDLTAEDAGLTHAKINGYIECLQGRIAELERHVQASESRRARATRRPSGAAHTLLPHDGGSHRSNLLSMPSVHTTGPAQGPSEEDSSVQDTMSAIGLLSNKAMAEPRVYSGDVLNKLAMPEVVSAALAVDGHNPSRASSSQPAFVMEDHLISLDRHSTRAYISQFLKWSVFLPHIDEDRLMEQYEAVIALEGQVARAGGLPHFNTYLAISIGIMMSAEATRLSTLALSLHAAAVKLLPRIFRSQEPLDALHSAVVYVCLAQRASGMNQQGLTQIFEVVSKASIVLTQYSSRFSALGTFQQFLLTLSTKMMAGLDQSHQVYQDTIPTSLPGHLRRFIQRHYSGEARAS